MAGIEKSHNFDIFVQGSEDHLVQQLPDGASREDIAEYAERHAKGDGDEDRAKRALDMDDFYGKRTES